MQVAVPFTVETKRATIEGVVHVLAYPGSPATYWHPGDPPEFEIDDVEVEYVDFVNGDFFTVVPEWVKSVVIDKLDENYIFDEAAELLQ